eukprot:3491629-Amphidinium_carterae.1
MDEWSTKVVSVLKTCSVERAQSILECYAQQIATNISSVEASHASIRRSIVGQSVQTRCAELAKGSAEYIFRQLRSFTGSILLKGRAIAKVDERRGRKRK